VNQGTNDGGMPAKDYQPLYARYLALIRVAYPKAKIAALRPFCGAQADSIKAAVDACHAAGDRKIHYIDTTGCFIGSRPDPVYCDPRAQGPRRRPGFYPQIRGTIPCQVFSAGWSSMVAERPLKVAVGFNPRFQG
jgi:hypothetical protein